MYVTWLPSSACICLKFTFASMQFIDLKSWGRISPLQAKASSAVAACRDRGAIDIVAWDGHRHNCSKSHGISEVQLPRSCRRQNSCADSEELVAILSVLSCFFWNGKKGGKGERNPDKGPAIWILQESQSGTRRTPLGAEVGRYHVETEVIVTNPGFLEGFVAWIPSRDVKVVNVLNAVLFLSWSYTTWRCRAKGDGQPWLSFTWVVRPALSLRYQTHQHGWWALRWIFPNS